MVVNYNCFHLNLIEFAHPIGWALFSDTRNIAFIVISDVQRSACRYAGKLRSPFWHVAGPSRKRRAHFCLQASSEAVELHVCYEFMHSHSDVKLELISEVAS